MLSLSEANPAVFCRATQQSFLRLLTTAALANQYGVAGLTNDDALLLLDRFMASSITVFREEPPGLLAVWRRLASRPTPAPRLWMDAYLAAFALTGGLGIITLDSDFGAFELTGLDVRVLEAR